MQMQMGQVCLPGRRQMPLLSLGGAASFVYVADGLWRYGHTDKRLHARLQARPKRVPVAATAVQVRSSRLWASQTRLTLRSR